MKKWLKTSWLFVEMIINSIYIYIYFKAFISRGIAANVLYNKVVVREFKLQLRYYVGFRADLYEKAKNSLIILLWFK